MFARQFNDFMIWILFAAVVLAALEGQLVEAAAITAILLLNGILGFVQEYQASNAIAALEEMTAPTSAVIRDGRELRIPALDLVPGDIVPLETGDRIPADGRLAVAVGLRVNEASLTGESEAVFKDTSPVPESAEAPGDQTDMLFAATSIVAGRAHMIVTETGPETEVGAVAQLLEATEQDRTPLQKELRTVGSRVAGAVLVIAVVVFVTGVAEAQLHAGGSLLSNLMHPGFRAVLSTQLLVAVSLAVAAVPEGLPAVVTLTLSIGVKAMAARNAIVRRLDAVETLGSTTFIATDKTGTLTRNAMTVSRIVLGDDTYQVLPDWTLRAEAAQPDAGDLALLLEAAAGANDARIDAAGTAIGDPTETALLEAAARLAAPASADAADARPAGSPTADALAPPRVAEVPFDARRKRMTTVHDTPRGLVAYMKGGPDVVLERCDCARLHGRTVQLDDDLRARLLAGAEHLAAQGYRTLAFAVRDLPAMPDERAGLVVDDAALERGMEFLGVAGLDDPPRPEVAEALAQARSAGIQVAMVTGDHADTAAAIGRQIGLGGDGSVVTGAELSAMTDDDLDRTTRETRIYARVDPGHKLRIVDSLKRQGHVVAMTGDGVNDAPALKRADIGVSMGLVGTDVARDASDMVLADDDFATIVEAVRQGRIVFDNIKKTILFLLSCNTSEVLIIFITQFFVTAPALLPLQLLWNNFITDGAPALALGVDPPDPGVMERAPRSAEAGVFARANQIQILSQGALLTISGLAVFAWAQWFMPGREVVLARTMLFTTMMLTQLLHALNFRVPRSTIWSAQSLKNRWLLLAAAVSLACQIAIVYVPVLQRVFGTAAMDAYQWLAVLAAAVVPVAIIDAVKVARVRREVAQAQPGQGSGEAA